MGDVIINFAKILEAVVITSSGSFVGTLHHYIILCILLIALSTLCIL